MEVLNDHVSSLSSDTINSKDNVVRIKATLDANLSLITLIFAAFIVFIRPTITSKKDFYKDALGDKASYLNPPPKWVFQFAWMVLDIFLYIIIVHFFYTNQNPPTENLVNNVLSVLSLIVSSIVLKWLWSVLFWNNNKYKAALYASVVVAMLLAMINIVLFSLFAYMSQWVSLALMFFIMLWSIVAVVWNIRVVYKYKPPTKSSRKDSCRNNI